MRLNLVVVGLLLLAFLPQAEGQAIDGGSTVSFNHATYHTCFPNIALVISAGCADWWVDSPKLMAPGRTGAITSPSCMAYVGYNNCYVLTVTVSTTVNPLVGLTIVNGGTSYAGCHVVGGSAPAATSVLMTVVRTFFIGVDEGSIYCGGVMLLTLQTAVGSTPIANVGGTFEFAVPYQDNQVRLCNSSEFTTDTVHPDTGSVLYPKRNACTTPQINNYNFICDAPGATPTAAPAATTTCNDLVLSGTLTLSGIPDTQQEIQAIADALAAGLDVNICPVSAPCYQVLSGSVNVPDVADSITDFTDTLCRPTGNHGHCELDIHGGLDINIENDATDDDVLTVGGDLGFNGNFTQNGNNTTNFEFFTPEVILLLLFFLMIVIAEWKKDLIYHVMAVLFGIALIGSGEYDGMMRLTIVGLIIYQIYRAYLVSQTSRNSLDNPANKED